MTSTHKIQDRLSTWKWQLAACCAGYDFTCLDFHGIYFHLHGVSTPNRNVFEQLDAQAARMSNYDAALALNNARRKLIQAMVMLQSGSRLERRLQGSATRSPGSWRRP
ncbi:MAG: hypothetical protein HY937_07770 [Nitrosomonadales bacterium]|nr:hypothetical protein [Nitrosomonadales bacterium]